MPKRDLERLFDRVREMAERLTEGEEEIPSSQLASELRQSGIDPEALKRRFYEAAKQIAARERAAGRPAPLAVQQVIEQAAPDDVMPADDKAAESKMGRWLEKFSAPFFLPDNLETARAYRKSGDVSEEEQDDLDDLERQLKDQLKKKHEGEA